MSAEPIYLDYAATAPVLPEVAARMGEVLALRLGNASSDHVPGHVARELVEQARSKVALLVGCDPPDLVFTSGATESNNLAITGTARAALAAGRKPHFVTLATEHKSVLEPLRALAAEGLAVTFLRPSADGTLDPATLAAALRADTALVSLLHVNNETGVFQDIPALATVCAARGVPLHVDCAQAAGKLPLSVEGITLLSVTAHKIGGPQGIGALYVAPGHRGHLKAQITGGGQERGLRAGTLPTHQIAGFGLAAQIATARQLEEAARLLALRERLWEGLADLPGVLRNGRPGAPHILNVTFSGVEGESLYSGLPELILSTGSACNSQSGEPSFVLRALGRDSEQAQSSLRFSLGYATTEEEIEGTIAAVRRTHARLWNASPARPSAHLDQPGEWWLGEAGAERLGTWVRFAVRVEEGVIREAHVQSYGCPHIAAVSNLLCEQLKGRSLHFIELGSPDLWRQAVQAPIEKLGRMLIIEDALNALRPVT